MVFWEGLRDTVTFMVYARSQPPGCNRVFTERKAGVMPQLTLSGVVLGLRSKQYDFKDQQTGERNAGVSHRLFLWDPNACEPIEITVRQDVLGLVGNLGEGELVTLNVEPRSSNNRVAFQFQSVASSDGQYFAVTGEQAPSKRTA